VHQPLRHSNVLLAGVLAGAFLLAPPALQAQQDSSMMKHDSAMMDHHDQMMGHDSAMAPNMMFMGAETHKAAGDYEIVETKGNQKIRFTDDFSVDQAPELHVVLSAGDTPDRDALDLGKLKKRQGGQSYDLPKGTDLSKYRKLLIWSKRLNRPVASAELHASGGEMEHM